MGQSMITSMLPVRASGQSMHGPINDNVHVTSACEWPEHPWPNNDNVHVTRMCLENKSMLEKLPPQPRPGHFRTANATRFTAACLFLSCGVSSGRNVV